MLGRWCLIEQERMKFDPSVRGIIDRLARYMWLALSTSTHQT